MARIRTPQPIPVDPAERQRWARVVARGTVAPESLLQRSAALRPADRIRTLYPVGIHAGAMMILRHAHAEGRRLPKGVKDLGDGSRWADGLAAAATLPPKFAFNGGPTAAAAIYRAGVERGILLTLEALKLRDRGVSS